jgi:hypothetical protein
VLEVVEEVVELGKEKVETGRMRIYNVVSESKVSKSIDLVDETVTVQRRAVDRAALEDAFKERVFELSEFDERAIVSKRAQVVEEVNLAKLAETKAPSFSLIRHDPSHLASPAGFRFVPCRRSCRPAFNLRPRQPQEFRRDRF